MLTNRSPQFLGALDQPRENQILGGTINIAGWVLTTLPEEVIIEFFVDNKIILGETQFIPRPDVAQVHPAFSARNPTPGFVLRVDTREFEDGEHILLCQAKAGNHSQILRRIKVTIQNRRVLYMHIPKAAGTSLNAYLESQFPRGKTALHIENLILGKLEHDVSGLDDKLFLSAHLKLDTLKRFVDIQDYFTITMLRDPIQQTISHLAWVKRLADPKYKKEFDNAPNYIKKCVERINGLDIVEFLDTLEQSEKNLFDNCQTRYLLPFHGEIELTDAHLHEALSKLNSFQWVGITEKYTESLLLLSFLMGWAPPQSQKKLNQSNRKFSFDYDAADEAVKKCLARVTRFDQEIYHHAVAVFEKQFRQMLHLLSLESPELSAISCSSSAPADFTLLAEKIKDRRSIS